MKKFRVLLSGTNLILGRENKEKDIRQGFYTTRWVEAIDSRAAEIIANDLIWGELKSRTLNDPSDPPKMHVEEIDELEEFGDHLVPGEGFTFYLEEE